MPRLDAVGLDGDETRRMLVLVTSVTSVRNGCGGAGEDRDG